jgi:hypothetical protein
MTEKERVQGAERVERALGREKVEGKREELATEEAAPFWRTLRGSGCIV